MRWPSRFESRRMVVLIQALSFLATLLLSMGSMIIFSTIILLEAVLLIASRFKLDSKWTMVLWELQWFAIVFGYTLLDFNAFYNTDESTPNLRALFCITLLSAEAILLYYLIFKERAVKRILLILSSSSAIAVFLIIAFIFNQGLPAFIENDPVEFLTGDTWQPFYQEPTTYELALGAAVDDYSFTAEMADEMIIVLPGQIAVFNLTICNTGALNDQYSVTCDAAGCSSSAGTISVASQASVNVELSIDGLANGTHEISIGVASSSAGETAQAVQTIIVSEEAFGLGPSLSTIESSSDNSTKSGQDLVLTNYDSAAHDYIITVDSSSYFRPYVSNCTWDNTAVEGTVHLEAGESIVLTVIPKMVVVVEGEYELRLNVTMADDSNLWDGSVIDFVYSSTDNLSLIDCTESASSSGSSASFTVSVNVVSEYSLKIMLDDLDDGWSYRIIHNGTVVAGNEESFEIDSNDTNSLYVIEATPLSEDAGPTNFNFVLFENFVQPTFGIFSFIVGTVTTTAIAIAIAAPLGIGCAVFLVEYCPSFLKKKLRVVFDLLAGIPSVIYGLWGALTLAPLLANSFYPALSDLFGGIWFLDGGSGDGKNILTASVVLAIMILPIIVSLSADSLLAVDPSLRKSSMGLGATRSQTIWRIMLPKASSGIISSIILGTGRAIGETMAVVMIMGSSTSMPGSLMDASGTMTTVIATTLSWGFSYDSLKHALFAIALILFAMVFILNVLIFRLKRELRSDSAHRFKRSRLVSFINGLKKRMLKHGGSTEFTEPKKMLFKERLFRSGVCACALAITCALLFILADILVRGGTSLEIDYIFQAETNAGVGGGFLNAIVGSLYLVALAILFSIFLATGSAIYMVEYASPDSKLANLILFTTNTLASTPSIIFGSFGFLFFVLYLDMGYSLLAGSLTLALMVLPLLLISTAEALKSVPQDFRSTSYALGVSKWNTIKNVVIPAAFPGIVSGVILSIGRAIGETAAIMFTAFYTSLVVDSLLMPTASLPNMIYKFYDLGALYPELEQKIYAGAVVLILMVLALNIIARVIADRATRFHQK